MMQGDMDDAHMPDVSGNVVGGVDVLPWVEKYRPQKMADLIAHKEIISTISNFTKKDQLPHLLFHGPAGTGKTSTILACAKEMYGKRKGAMVLEMNASDARGIDVVRDQIKAFVSARELFATGQPKLVVLDEADNMTSTAQMALRRIIEQYSKNARFCLICNFPSRIIPALQSRCTKFRFAPLSHDEVKGRIHEIAQLEQLKISEDGVEALIKLANGDMRKVLNMMQSTSMAHTDITAEHVHLQVGQPLKSDIDIVLGLLNSGSFSTAFNQIDRMRIVKGYSLIDIIAALNERFFQIEFPEKGRAGLHSDLSDIEYRLTLGGCEKIQTAALVGSFKRHRVV